MTPYQDWPSRKDRLEWRLKKEEKKSVENPKAHFLNHQLSKRIREKLGSKFGVGRDEPGYTKARRAVILYKVKISCV